MADLFWLTKAQIRRIAPYFSLSHGVPRVDNQRVVSGIIYVIRHGLRWRDALGQYGPHETLYHRFIRWSRLGVFNRTFACLAGQAGEPDRLMINATHLKAYRTAVNLLKKRRCSPPYRKDQRRPELHAPRCLRGKGPTAGPAAHRGRDGAITRARR